MSVLNYTVTSNHIHLVVRDMGIGDVIPKSIQLIAGRTGQEFNLRKNSRALIGKTAIMRRRLKPAGIWSNVSFILILIWFARDGKASQPMAVWRI